MPCLPQLATTYLYRQTQKGHKPTEDFLINAEILKVGYTAAC